MNVIEITGGIEQLTDRLKGIDAAEDALKKASASAVNKTAVSTRAEAIRLLRRDYNMKAGSIRDALSIRKATMNSQEARIFGSGSPGIPLSEFSVLPSRVPSTKKLKGGKWSPEKGISVIVAKGERKTITGAFSAGMSSGHIGVFQRRDMSDGPKYSQGLKRKAVARAKELGSKTKAAREFGVSATAIARWNRYGVKPDSATPANRRIKELYGPSPFMILASDKYNIPLDEFTGDELDKNMQHEADFFLRRAGIAI
jgi:hypothetical protein